MTKPLRGVNLGGWLVLEPWITPSLFKGTSAPDEFTYCDQADPERFHMLKQHHAKWITKSDFKWLAEQGFDAVRIPVGYWIFGSVTPYVGSISYLDRAFEWAQEYNLKILICLHGAPGSQNGEMHSGESGPTGWAEQPTNIEISLQTIKRLAERYKSSAALLGIELLNEPSMTIPRAQLTTYYKQGYKLIRALCGPRTWVVFSDRFQPRNWWWLLHWPLHRNAVQDNHHYQIFTLEDKALTVSGHLAKAAKSALIFRFIASHRKIIIGEWSAALDAQSLKDVETVALKQAYTAYTQAQIKAFATTDGWFYWTYRTEDAGPWSLRDMVEQGVFPTTDRL
jgi:glucan 1,3-beta-glucosidase